MRFVNGVDPPAELPDQFLSIAVFVMGAGRLKTLLDFFPSNESSRIILLPSANSSFHLFLR